MKTIHVIPFLLALTGSCLANAEQLLCLPDTTMQISSTNTNTGRVRQTSQNTLIIKKLPNNISILQGKEQIDFQKLNNYIYTSGFGTIILHPENDSRIIVSAFRPADSKGKSSVETTVYDCNTL
ncbi:hypothetical protein [Methylotuvimicrobium sp.]|uniref:hypothetical protein n=1 Tax=Methylotuvimicrobium sp. TaxID=2822413 RepID=UPI003D64AC69